MAPNGKLSQAFSLYNGASKGLFFILAINDIRSDIRLPVKYVLYVDDRVIINTGFTFPTENFEMIKFHKKGGTKNTPINYNGISLFVIMHHKILGPTFNSRLTWK